MEGPSDVSSKLKFLESKIRLQTSQTNVADGYRPLAVANNHHMVILGFDDSTIKTVPIHQCIDFSPKKPETIPLNQFNYTVRVSSKPMLLSVARHGFSSVLFVSGLNESGGLVLEAIDLDTRAPIGQKVLDKSYGSAIVDYAWHPNFYDSILALCTNFGHLVLVAIDRKAKGLDIIFQEPKLAAACCWSPKGKNLAIGTLDSRLYRMVYVLSQTDKRLTLKEVENSTLNISNPKLTPDHRLVKLEWINKNFFLCAHAKKTDGGPDTVYSLLTFKPSKPFRYWANLSYENQNRPPDSYQCHILNLTHFVVCTSSASGEAAILGVEEPDEAKTLELESWRSITIDEEGARLELPLNANNCETYAQSVALAFLDKRPVMIVQSSDGLVCSYEIVHSQANLLRLPEFQPTQECPVSIVKAPTGLSSMGAFGQGSTFTQSLPPIDLSNSQPFQMSSGALSFASLSIQASGGVAPLPAGAAAPPSGAQPFQFGQGYKPASFSALAQPNVAPTSNTSTNPGASQLQSPFLASQSALSFTNPKPLPTSALTLALTQPQPQQTQPQLQQQVPAPAQTPSFTQQQQQPQPRPQQTQPQPQQQVPAPAQTLTLTQQQPQPQQTQPQPQLQQPKPLTQQPQQTQPQLRQQAPATAQTLKAKQEFEREIEEVRKKMDYNEMFLTLLDEVNYLRRNFDEILEMHSTHRDAIEAIREDINALDLGMLENLYLIEFIKTRSRKSGSRKSALDPVTVKRVTSMKEKLKTVADKLRELNTNVDLAWEEYRRRKDNKAPRLNSLELIYKTLATNQKIISFLKKRAESIGGDTSGCKSPSAGQKLNSSFGLTSPISNNSDLNASQQPQQQHRRELDPARMKAFREFLTSRPVVPVRRLV